jgi:hypothetical protein
MPWLLLLLLLLLLPLLLLPLLLQSVYGAGQTLVSACLCVSRRPWQNVSQSSAPVSTVHTAQLVPCAGYVSDMLLAL